MYTIRIYNPDTDECLVLTWHDGFRTHSTGSEHEGRFFESALDGRYYEIGEDGKAREAAWLPLFD